MSAPQTINGLMRHLRNDCNIKISGTYQKQQLVSYGYYHGYKGYRFIRNNSNQIPYTDFSEVRAKKLVKEFKEQNQLLQKNVAPPIYVLIIQQNVTHKINALENYLNT